MKKQILTLLICLLPWLSPAAEIEGVKLADSVRVSDAGSDLVLNGAGVRTRVVFKVYVSALYLQQKRSALIVGQLIQAGQQTPARSTPESDFFGRRMGRIGRRRTFVQQAAAEQPSGFEAIAVFVVGIELHLASAHAQAVHREVVGDGEGPGTPRRALRRKAGACGHYAQPRVLKHLVDLGRQTQPQQALDEAIQRVFMTCIEHVESGRVACRIGEHQLIVPHGVGGGRGSGVRFEGGSEHRAIFT